MKKLFTLLFAIATMQFAIAQINIDSPFPVDVEVLSPAGIAGVYDYGTQSGWGPTLSETVTGQLQWAFTEVDSMACGEILADLTGKFALIRRGGCNFTVKTYNAQLAGAAGVVICNHYTTATDGATTVYNMSADPTFDSTITVPAVFLSRASCETIVPVVDSGTPVEMSFTIKTFYGGVASYSYHTPLSQAVPVDVLSVNYVNASPDPLTVTASVTITDPNGVETVLTGSKDIAGLSDSAIAMVGTYTPTELGEYTAVFANDQNDETIATKFEMTDFTWALDNGTLDGSAGPSDASFVDPYNLTYNIGSLVIAGPDGGVVTHASFGLANPGSLISGDPALDVINVVLFDADANDDNVIDFAASGASFDNLTPIALASYSITAATPANELLLVELESLSGDVVELEPGGAYYIALLYDGSGPALSIAPRFLASSNVEYANFPTQPLFLDILYSGWSDRTVAARLHLDGFVTGTEDIQPLDAFKVKVMPNPASEYLNLGFELDQTAKEVQVGILDINGKMIGQQRLENVLNETYRFDVHDLPNGTYVLSILTPEGYRAERFVIAR